MLINTTIVCFGEDISASVLSKFQILSRLSKSNDIHYVESIGQRIPSLNRRDLRRILEKIRRIGVTLYKPKSLEVSVPISDFEVISPRVLPFHQSKLVQRFNTAMLAQQIHVPMNPQQRTRPLILWVGLPTVPPQMLKWHPNVVIYHCADKLVANVSGEQRKILDKAHDFWMKHADLVITPSETYLIELKQKSNNAHLLPHGVDFLHFTQGGDSSKAPADIANFFPPLIGYTGTISSEWFDASLLGEVAQLCPEMTFLLIGPTHPELRHHPDLQKANIHFLGPRSYQELPSYLNAFSVCIIPKVRSEMTNASMPLKLREYLAAGKPIVSTLPVPAQFSNLVTVVKDAENFATALKKCVQIDTPEMYTARQMAVRNDSWEAVTETLSQLIASCMRERGK